MPMPGGGSLGQKTIPGWLARLRKSKPCPQCQASRARAKSSVTTWQFGHVKPRVQFSRTFYDTAFFSLYKAVCV